MVVKPSPRRATRATRCWGSVGALPSPGRAHSMPRFSPFAPRTTPLMEGQHWRRWAGYVTASSYELTHEREYAAIRNAAALIDVTPLYKYMIEGRDAARLLDRIVTR